MDFMVLFIIFWIFILDYFLISFSLNISIQNFSKYLEVVKGGWVVMQAQVLVYSIFKATTLYFITSELNVGFSCTNFSMLFVIYTLLCYSIINIYIYFNLTLKVYNLALDVYTVYFFITLYYILERYIGWFYLYNNIVVWYMLIMYLTGVTLLFYLYINEFNLSRPLVSLNYAPQYFLIEFIQISILIATMVLLSLIEFNTLPIVELVTSNRILCIMYTLLFSNIIMLTICTNNIRRYGWVDALVYSIVLLLFSIGSAYMYSIFPYMFTTPYIRYKQDLFSLLAIILKNLVLPLLSSWSVVYIYTLNKISNNIVEAKLVNIKDTIMELTLYCSVLYFITLYLHFCIKTLNVLVLTFICISVLDMLILFYKGSLPGIRTKHLEFYLVWFFNIVILNAKKIIFLLTLSINKILYLCLVDWYSIFYIIFSNTYFYISIYTLILSFLFITYLFPRNYTIGWGVSYFYRLVSLSIVGLLIGPICARGFNPISNYLNIYLIVLILFIILLLNIYTFNNKYNNSILYVSIENLVLLYSIFFFIYALVFKASSIMEFYMFLEALSILTIISILVLRIKSSKTNIYEIVEVASLYFIICMLSGGLLLIGFILLILSSGSMVLAQIEWYITSYNMLSLNYAGVNILFYNVIAGSLLLLTGMVLKLGLFPLHYWLADLYNNTSAMFLILYNILIKPSFIIWFIRVYLLYSFNLYKLSAVLLVISLGSIIVGFFGSFNSTSFKGFLAYSGIFQLGFTTLSLVSGSLWQGVETSIFFYSAYLIHIIPVLLIVSMFESIRLGYQKSMSIASFQNFCRRGILKSSVLSLSFFSFIGLPPTIGFFSKLSLIIYTSEVLGLYIGVFLVIMAIGSSFYYLRIIKTIYYSVQDFRNCLIVSNNMSAQNSLFIATYLFTTLGITFFIYQDTGLMIILEQVIV